VKSGRVRALATANPQRTQHFPDIPTAREAGFPTVEMTNYYAMLAPAKTPRDIVVKLHDAIVKAVETPAVRERLLSVGADPLTMSMEEFTRYLRADIARWDKLVKSVGIQFDR
jgi:tripartite-type tricarboxylate transporter receptor subunit TctC